MSDANRNFEIMSGRAHPQLAQDIADHLDMPLIVSDLGPFANQETYLRISESVRGKQMYVVQPHGGYLDPNNAIIEHALMLRTSVASDAKKAVAVMPYMGYSRADKNSVGREAPGARLMVDILTEAGKATHLIGMELHAGQIQQYTHKPFAHLNPDKLLIKYIFETFADEIGRGEFAVVAPDVGRADKVRKIQLALGLPTRNFAIIDKERSDNSETQAGIANEISTHGIIGDIKNKVVLTIDDMIDTGGTTRGAAETALDEGEAKEVHVYGTHPIFSTKEGIKAIDRLGDSAIKSVVTTDTLPIIYPDTYNKLKIIKTSELLAKTIRNHATNRSTSALL